MIKQIIFKIAKRLWVWAFYKIFDYIDENDDGRISLEELNELKKDLKYWGEELKRLKNGKS